MTIRSDVLVLALLTMLPAAGIAQDVAQWPNDDNWGISQVSGETALRHTVLGAIMPARGTEPPARARAPRRRFVLPISGTSVAADGDCDTCEPDCCRPFWSHRCAVFADYLFLSVRGANVPYATPQNGLGVGARPIGPMSVVYPDRSRGVRVGFVKDLDSCSSIVSTFTHFDSNTTDRVSLPGGTGFIRANLTHPNTANAAADSLFAQADYDVRFITADVNYRWLKHGNECSSLNFLLGIRYAELDQELTADYLIAGRTTVETDIDFFGFGPRVGLEGERKLGGGFLVYGKGFANFIVGEFDADFRQSNVAAGRQAQIGWDDQRIVTQIEVELGLGWQNRPGTVRLFAGYSLNTWFNSVTTPSWVNGIQTNNFVTDHSERITFDGLAVRLELRR